MGLSLVIIERGILAETDNAEYYARRICTLMEKKHEAYMRVEALKRQRRWLLIKRYFAEKFNMRETDGH